MPRVVVKPAFYFALLMTIMLVPIKLTIAWFVALCVHELGHYLALRCFEIPVYCLDIGINGVQMQTETISGVKGLVCVLTGPMFGLMLILVRRLFPVLALCGFVHSLVNLLPILPLDGGRLLSILLSRCPEKRAMWIFQLVEGSVLMGIMAIGCYLSFVRLLGLVPFFASVFLILRRKLSCKAQRQRVQ